MRTIFFKIMLEESDKARRKRIHNRITWYSGSIIFTMILLSLDLYIIFGGRLATIKGDLMNVHIGPLFTRYCLNNETYAKIIIETGDPNYPRCVRELFYQVTNDVMPPELHLSGDIMLSTWIPILAGIILTRMTLWRLHAITQTLVSCSYIGVYIIVGGATYQGTDYERGSAFIIWLTRLIICAIASTVISIDFVVSLLRLKCCPDPDLDPILIGRSFNDLDNNYECNECNDNNSDDPDIVDQHFWNAKKMPLKNVSLGLKD